MTAPPWPLVAVTWEDTTNVQAWSTLEDVASFAADGGWRATNVGYLVHDGDDCVVLAARIALDAEPVQVGLYERIPTRSIIERRVLT